MAIGAITITHRDNGTDAASQPLGPMLFFILQCQDLRVPALRLGLDGVDEVRLGRGELLSVDRRREGGQSVLDVKIPDPWMSSRHTTLVRAGARFLARDESSKNGTLLGGAPSARR